MSKNYDDFEKRARKAKEKYAMLSLLPTSTKNEILLKIAEAIESNKTEIMRANSDDCHAAQTLLREKKITKAVFERLQLNEDKFKKLSVYPRTIEKLEDHVGKKDYEILLDKDLILSRHKVPMGLIAVIFESRPEVVIQISSLMIKTGNAVFLKGGSETRLTNNCLSEIVRGVLSEYDLEDCVFMLNDREEVKRILQFDEYIDLIIPRGGNELVNYVMDNTKIPVLGHRDGICHIYIDSDANDEKTVPCVVDAKTDYPSVCNAVETLLVHQEKISVLPEILRRLAEKEVNFYTDEATREIASKAGIHTELATEKSWDTEYCDLILNVKVVPDAQAAINHINLHGSGHTDSIFTENDETAALFFHGVDSASVFHNTSTRFCDGFVFGLGAEVGISCEKIHARGPVGMEGLLTTKFFLKGQGHKISDFKNKPFLHKRILP